MIRPQDIQALLEKTDWTQSQLAKEVGTTQATVSRWVNKGQVPDSSSEDKLEALFDRYGIERVDSSEIIPVVGTVGAGAAIERIHGDAQGQLGNAPTFPGATADTVAVEIRGESLGALFDQWLVYYDEVHRPPTTYMLGKLCVCGLSDGRVLIKKLTDSKEQYGAYTLLSNYEPPIYDVFLDWAALVLHMRPR